MMGLSGWIRSRSIRTAVAVTCVATIAQAANAGWVQQAELLPDGDVTGLFFGNSVAISGDTAIVGAEYEDNENGISAGSVYVSKATEAGWIKDAKLLPEDGEADQRFGVSVAISGNMAIVGSASHNQDGPGPAYVFQETDSEWKQVARLLPEDVDDSFGRTVAISGDTAIVGASRDAEAGTKAGAAYVFQDTSDGWSEVTKLLPPDGLRESFGSAIAVDGSTAIVGASGFYTGATAPHAAYIFEDDGSGWTQAAELLPPDGGPREGFGGSVSISGGTVIVGADHHPWGDKSGAAYVFEKGGTGWAQSAKLVSEDHTPNQRFGGSVSISGDIAVIGANRDRGPDSESYTEYGAAYIFQKEGTGWVQVDKLLGDDIVDNDHFGADVAISGDTAIISAPSHGHVYDLAGAAYVFVVPEPSSVALLLSSSVGLLVLTCRRPRHTT